MRVAGGTSLVKEPQWPGGQLTKRSTIPEGMPVGSDRILSPGMVTITPGCDVPIGGCCCCCCCCVSWDVLDVLALEARTHSPLCK